jgi:hypothetical protein
MPDDTPTPLPVDAIEMAREKYKHLQDGIQAQHNATRAGETASDARIAGAHDEAEEWEAYAERQRAAAAEAAAKADEWQKLIP